MQKISSFLPIIDKESKILILGSIPGVKSLEMQQYYAHPQNKFWKIIFELFTEKFTTDYDERIKILEKYHVALWDVIDNCERKGSLDSEIRNEEANKIGELLHNYPNIKAIFCNGQKSHKNLQKILPKDFHLPIIVLPSTSPAHASLRYEEKLKSWKMVLNYL
ncbi:DNA-deoxyinosine glycosylase [Cloacibacterium normanense]|uniref:DNA-deoxyinosine glycosylase n=1 Tax=Cloacibacterium normanense TaxID=237258 RepID=A0A2S7I8W8_9FLAO|nr:DNA-deoxyinosine glycosylase [Cloacibacterium normanense]PPZ93020.1 DNA-deoxyinosine glycosylase [Cloacibacterium normanense]